MRLTLNLRFRLYLRLLRIAAKFLHLRLNRSEENRLLARQAITTTLGKAGGIIMKIGQVVADTSHDSSLEPLLTGVPPRKLSEIVGVLETAPGHPSLEDFQSIDKQGKAASLGQVHRAVLRTGETVAVKLQYPNIKKTVESELALAGLLPAVGPVKKWGMDLNAYKKTLTNNMHAELDYRAEASRQIRFYRGLNIDGVKIPKVYESLCSDRVLVQSWEAGVFFPEILDWPVAERMLIGRALLMVLFQSLFKLGEVHGDPHMGNTFYRRKADGKPEIVLLDFGCTINVSKQQRMALLKMIISLRESGDESPLACFAAMGFDPGKLSHIAEALPAVARILFKPFLSDEPFATEQWGVKRGFNLLLEERRWWFRSAGPSDLFLLLRAFQGVVRQMQQLGIQLPWWPLLVKAAGKALVDEARGYELPAIPNDILAPKLSFKTIASKLRVEIRKGNEVILDSTLPPDAALELDTIIPEPILQRILESGACDFDAMQERLIETRLAPQQLFSMTEGANSYKVWLE